MTVRHFAHLTDHHLHMLVAALRDIPAALPLFALALVEVRLRRYRGATPAVPADIERMLDSMEKHIMSDPNLDAIANDWSQLSNAITQRLTADANTIASLTSELASAATSSTPISDARAAQIDSEMKAVLASLQGTASAVQSAPGPSAGATGATGPAPVGATGATAGSTGASPAVGATPGTSPAIGTTSSASVGASGATGPAPVAPGTPPAGSAAN